MTDPIADMLTRIRNACQAQHHKVDIPASKMKMAIAKILKDNNFISNFKFINDNKQGMLRVYLKYYQKEPVIRNIERASKPGRRNYVSYTDIKPVLNGFGIQILSTSKGVITGRDARREKVGGEVICRVW